MQNMEITTFPSEITALKIKWDGYMQEVTVQLEGRSVFAGGICFQSKIECG